MNLSIYELLNLELNSIPILTLNIKSNLNLTSAIHLKTLTSCLIHLQYLCHDIHPHNGKDKIHTKSTHCTHYLPWLTRRAGVRLPRLVVIWSSLSQTSTHFWKASICFTQISLTHRTSNTSVWENAHIRSRHLALSSCILSARASSKPLLHFALCIGSSYYCLFLAMWHDEGEEGEEETRWRQEDVFIRRK